MPGGPAQHTGLFWRPPTIGGRKFRQRLIAPAAEAKYAHGASLTALRIPKPPHLTGRVAWSHIWSEKLMLAILDTRERTITSRGLSSALRKHGAVLRRNVSLGRNRAWRRRSQASLE